MAVERPGVAAEAWRRLGRHTGLKAVGTTVFMTVFFLAYFELLKAPLFPPTPVPLTTLDRWIGFQPLALPVYASLWLYVSLPPAFIVDRRRLFAYGRAIGGLCLAGLLWFLLFPTVTPAALVDWDRYPGFAILKGLDANGNACPSLHVATAVFSGLWLHRQLRDMGAGRLLRQANALWCAGIVYSTLATKQHVALDVVAGLALGWLWQAVAWRRQPVEGDR